MEDHPLKVKLTVEKAIGADGRRLQPGPVDILHTAMQDGTIQTKLILQNVAMVQFIAEGTPGPDKVWLELTPEQAAIVNEAKKTGAFQVTSCKKPWWRFW